MLKIFTRYVSIGVVNTIIHWMCFGFLLYYFEESQAISNLVAFAVAVTFSFFANAIWTFKTRATSGRYVAFVLFMGMMATFTGYLADSLGLPPVVTLVVFSAFSLTAGFLYSKFIVFRNAK
ncbi:GtrA family protein [Citrobacter sp. Cb004]|uniref:GtrA family protein n=1 Tax=Citrobacter sp. Cb004 TaxID=2985006 RepID=UPI0025761515|nr:GtrA family protein [Citrobacter sp. Cb004]MDM3355454.1 GtrA family protein [Citrobacter sp. Cb004]